MPSSRGHHGYAIGCRRDEGSGHTARRKPLSGGDRMIGAAPCDRLRRLRASSRHGECRPVIPRQNLESGVRGRLTRRLLAAGRLIGVLGCN